MPDCKAGVVHSYQLSIWYHVIFELPFRYAIIGMPLYLATAVVTHDIITINTVLPIDDSSDSACFDVACHCVRGVRVRGFGFFALGRGPD